MSFYCCVFVFNVAGSFVLWYSYSAHFILLFIYRFIVLLYSIVPILFLPAHNSVCHILYILFIYLLFFYISSYCTIYYICYICICIYIIIYYLYVTTYILHTT